MLSIVVDLWGSSLMGDTLGWHMPSRLTGPRKNAARKGIPTKVMTSPLQIINGRARRWTPPVVDLWESNLMGGTLGWRLPNRPTDPRKNAARKEIPTQVRAAMC